MKISYHACLDKKTIYELLLESMIKVYKKYHTRIQKTTPIQDKEINSPIKNSEEIIERKKQTFNE